MAQELTSPILGQQRNGCADRVPGDDRGNGCARWHNGPRLLVRTVHGIRRPKSNGRDKEAINMPRERETKTRTVTNKAIGLGIEAENITHDSNKAMRIFLATAASTASLLAALHASPAKAVLAYHIYDSSGDLIIETTGSLAIPAPTAETTFCGASGALGLSGAVICTGMDLRSPVYSISGPSSIYLGGSSLSASSASGLFTSLDGPDRFAISAFYVSGEPIVSGAIFKNLSLASLGLPSSGTLATWTLAETGDTIQLIIGEPSANTVPGPLPWIGVTTAFGFSSRLRNRMAQRSRASLHR
jgi:hypothetical protein